MADVINIDCLRPAAQAQLGEARAREVAESSAWDSDLPAFWDLTRRGVPPRP